MEAGDPEHTYLQFELILIHMAVEHIYHQLWSTQPGTVDNGHLSKFDRMDMVELALEGEVYYEPKHRVRK
jgi:hypothetical protein